MRSAHKKAVLGKVIVYVILILIALIMIIPFLWMLSASIKSDRGGFPDESLCIHSGKSQME